jgi:hypothetical protein
MREYNLNNKILCVNNNISHKKVSAQLFPLHASVLREFILTSFEINKRN